MVRATLLFKQADQSFLGSVNLRDSYEAEDFCRKLTADKINEVCVTQGAEQRLATLQMWETVTHTYFMQTR